MLSQDEITDIHATYKRKGYGSISPREAHFQQEMIASYQPQYFLETGTASGLSNRRSTFSSAE